MAKLSKSIASPKAIIIVAAGIAVVAALGVYAYSHHPVQTHPGAETFYPKAAEGQTPVPTPTPKNASPTPTIPPSNATTTSQSGLIVITTPTQGDTITSGTHVSGHARVGADKLYYRVKAGKSGQLALGPVQTDAAGNYSFDIAFTNQVNGGSDQGSLEVYSLSTSQTQTNQASVLVNIKG